MSLEVIADLTVLYNEPLAKYTAARLGGPADTVAIARTRQALLEAVIYAHQQHIPYWVLGGGANVLVADGGVRGLVIINHTKGVEIDPATGRVQAESGVSLITLARRCLVQGLKGLEWAVSIPGTLGGAVVNNAGAHGGDMAGNLVQAIIMDIEASYEPSVWPVERLAYAYRYSILKGQHQYLVLDATLQLEAGHDPHELTVTADGFIAHRKRTQPPGASLGSMFKNPSGDYAGRLIEAAGLKGHQVGGVQISPIHANFFINLDAGTATDYHALIELVQSQVLARFGVELELEIELLGDK
ncbi:MAG: UDP-N-acetylmuramate dehydrogenase [Anaerolineales bacterium]|nr:UDP-N-acetylmuramate dehydrogenase [Anaerolineales bacterium]